jgi:hypothetical protein
MPVYNYTTLDDPLQVGFTTEADDINDAGQIVGARFGGTNHADRTQKFPRQPSAVSGQVSAPRLQYRRHLHRAHLTHTSSPPAYLAAVGTGRPRPRHSQCARGR